MERKDSTDLQDLGYLELALHSRSAGSIHLSGSQEGALVGFPSVKKHVGGGRNFGDSSRRRPMTTASYFASQTHQGGRGSRTSTLDSQRTAPSRSRKRFQGIPADISTDSPSAFDAYVAQSKTGEESELHVFLFFMHAMTLSLFLMDTHQRPRRQDPFLYACSQRRTILKAHFENVKTEVCVRARSFCSFPKGP